MTADHWFGILQSLLILVTAWLGRLVGLVLREVRAINGRIVRLEQWREDAEQSLDRRFHDADARMTRIEDRSHFPHKS